MLPDLSKEKQLGILRKMLMIRRAEEHVIRFNEEHEGLIRGHFHVYIGQEATGVSVCEALTSKDYVFSTHRNHGHVIAKGGDPGKVLAEIIGRETGYCRGRAGTFHVAAPDLGIIHTSAIVGGCLALAAGTAFASQVQQSRRGISGLFGDGAMEEGVFYEALNMAKLWQLPLIFLMENNYRRAGRSGSSHSAKNSQTFLGPSTSKRRSSTAATSAPCIRLQRSWCDGRALGRAVLCRSPHPSLAGQRRRSSQARCGFDQYWVGLGCRRSARCGALLVCGR